MRDETPDVSRGKAATELKSDGSTEPSVTFPHHFHLPPKKLKQRCPLPPLCARSRPSTAASTRSATWPRPTSVSRSTSGKKLQSPRDVADRGSPSRGERAVFAGATRSTRRSSAFRVVGVLPDMSSPLVLRITRSSPRTRQPEPRRSPHLI